MFILILERVFIRSWHLFWLTGPWGITFFLAACQPLGSEPSLSSSIVAVIGQDVITLYELENHYKENADHLLFGDESEDLQTLKRSLLNQLIDQRLFVAEALRLRLVVEPEELNLAIKKLRGGYSEEDFRNLIEEQKIDIANWEERLSQELLIQKLIQGVFVNLPIKIEDQELKEYYEAHLGEFRQEERMWARQIVLPSMKEAEEVHQLASAGHDFAKLAEEHSISPDAARGGDLGQFRIDEMPEGFDILQGLEIGKISSIIRTPYGYHIFKMEKKEPNRELTQKEAHVKIREMLTQRTQKRLFSDWAENLRKKAKVKVNYAIL